MNVYIPGLGTTQTRNRVDFSLWVYDDSKLPYGRCAACCEEVFTKPSNFCPRCGATMLNVEDATAHYSKIMENNGKDGNGNV